MDKSKFINEFINSKKYHKKILSKTYPFLKLDKNRDYYDKYKYISIDNSLDKLNFIYQTPDQYAINLTYFCADIYKKMNITYLIDSILNGFYYEPYTYLVYLFNKISSSVINNPHLYKYFINLAIELEKYKNYHCLFAVIVGFNNIDIKWTKKLYKDYYNYYVDLFCPFLNYKNYRTRILNNINDPIIPYIGVICSDIIKLAEFNYINYNKNKVDAKLLKNAYNYIKSIEKYNYDYNILPTTSKLYKSNSFNLTVKNNNTLKHTLSTPIFLFK